MVDSDRRSGFYNLPLHNWRFSALVLSSSVQGALPESTQRGKIMFELPLHDEETDEQQRLRIDIAGLPGVVQRSVEELLQARVHINERLLASRYATFTQDTGIEISPGAQELIKLILTSILSDPHPLWDIRPNQRVGVVQHYIAELPTKLAELVEEEQVQEQITSFDVLHWLSRDRDMARLCIIEKRAK